MAEVDLAHWILRPKIDSYVFTTFDNFLFYLGGMAGGTCDLLNGTVSQKSFVTCVTKFEGIHAFAHGIRTWLFSRLFLRFFYFFYFLAFLVDVTFFSNLPLAISRKYPDEGLVSQWNMFGAFSHSVYTLTQIEKIERNLSKNLSKTFLRFSWFLSRFGWFLHFLREIRAV